MKLDRFLFYLVCFLLVMIMTSLYYPLRYVKYALPLLPLFLIHTRKSIIDKRILSYYLTFIVFYGVLIIYLLIQNLVIFDISARFFPNAVFIITPLLFILLLLPYFNPDKIRRYVLVIFYVNICIFLYEEFDGLVKVLTNFDLFADALISSELETESNLAYVFGFLVLFFLFERHKYSKWYLILSSLFFILCFKRIVIVAVLLCVIINFIAFLLKINLSRYRAALTFFGLLANLFFIQFAYLITSGEFDQYIFEKTGYNADRFLMGRKTLYTNAFDAGGAFDLMGLGLGKIDDVMFKFYGVAFNLHSELIKNYFEFGLLFFIAWLLLLFYKTMFSNKAVIILIYFNILILTDNVFIYFDIMFYFYFFVLIYLSQKFEPSIFYKNEQNS